MGIPFFREARLDRWVGDWGIQPDRTAVREVVDRTVRVGGWRGRTTSGDHRVDSLVDAARPHRHSPVKPVEDSQEPGPV